MIVFVVFVSEKGKNGNFSLCQKLDVGDVPDVALLAMSVTLPCEKRSKFPKSEKTLQLSHKQRHLTLQFVSKDWDCSKSKCLNAQCTSIQRALVVVTVSCW